MLPRAAFDRLVRCPAAALRRLWRDRRGNYSMIVVLLLPVLTGFVGVGTEAGLWLFDQQSEQTAADSAAFSAAVYYQGQEPSPGSSASSNGMTQALAVAASYGFTGTASSPCSTSGSVTTCTQPANCNINSPGIGTPCVQVNNPPVAGTQQGNTAAFEVTIAQSPQQLFSKVLMSNPVVIKARTVGYVKATTTPGPPTTTPCSGTSCVCVKVTATLNVSSAANFSGTASLNLANCSLEVDDPNASGLNLSGTSTVSATDIYLANSSLSAGVGGTSTLTGTKTALPTGGIADPYQTQLTNATFSNGNAAIPTITTAVPGSCSGASVTTGGGTIGPTSDGVIYYSQMHIVSSTVLRPGTYYICPGGNFTASGTATISTAPFPLPTGCATPYSLCQNNNTTAPFAAGDGVTIVLLGLTGTTGTVTNCPYFNLSGTTTLDLVPPDTGPFSGIILTSTIGCTPPAVGASGNQIGTATISGASTSNIYGAVDLPDYSITYSGTSNATSGCLNIVAYSFTATGTSSLANNCSNVGTSSIGPPTMSSSSSSTTVYSAQLAN